MPTVSNQIGNPNFEAGDTLWTKGDGWQISTSSSAYEGEWVGKVDTDDTGSSESEILNDYVVPFSEGLSLTATCRVYGAGADNNIAAVLIDWLDASMVRISKSQGNSSNSGSRGRWEVSTVTAVAPTNTAYARVGAWGKAVSNGVIKVDQFTWSYTNDRAVTLTSPEEGATFGLGDTVLLSVEITGTEPAVDYVEYFSDQDGSIATTSDPDYSFNVTDLTAGDHEITAVVHLETGATITSAGVNITVDPAPPPPTTREFKASNSYTYLVGKNFSGLSSFIPSTAQITGAELLVDYTTRIMVRSKDLAVEDPNGANPNVIFDIVDGGVVEAILMSDDSGTYTQQGGPLSTTIALQRSDYDLVEEGTSEGKKWTMLDSSPAQIVLGGESSLFGLGPIATADFLERSVGIRFYPNLKTKPSYADSGDAVIRLLIDKLRLRVYFDAGSAEYYFASPDKTKVIKGVLVSANVTEGDLSTGDATGVLQLTSDLEVMDGTQTYIGDDWTIHAAYPPTDANQIGTVGARELDDNIGMSYNGLPSAAAVVNNRSRYEFITANFFAVTELDSIYGVHGLPRAFAYNGDFFYKIYTQADPEKDKPRHLANHHLHLALGFDDGRVDLSVVGKPYNYRGEDGASEFSIADKVTGLLPLSGTILGMFGSKSVWGLSGTTINNFATQVIAPNIGAVEYTVTDMGFPVYANAYGIYTLAQTQQYGDYLGTPMSQDVSPWLRPRLVRKYTSDKEVVVAWPVRSKNQYRLAFKDGYILSMTLNAGQQSAPTFSFQQYVIYNEEDES